jgi:hypothetical protein
MDKNVKEKVEAATEAVTEKVADAVEALTPKAPFYKGVIPKVTNVVTNTGKTLNRAKVGILSTASMLGVGVLYYTGAQIAINLSAQIAGNTSAIAELAKVVNALSIWNLPLW